MVTKVKHKPLTLMLFLGTLQHYQGVCGLQLVRGRFLLVATTEGAGQTVASVWGATYEGWREKQNALQTPDLGVSLVSALCMLWFVPPMCTYSLPLTSGMQVQQYSTEARDRQGSREMMQKKSLGGSLEEEPKNGGTAGS